MQAIAETHERELKLSVGPDFALSELSGEELTERIFDSIYYDTADQRLTRAGATLRGPDSFGCPDSCGSRPRDACCGEHQDAVVAEERLLEAATRLRDPVAAFIPGRLAEQQAHRRRRAQEALPKKWAKLEKSGLQLLR